MCGGREGGVLQYRFYHHASLVRPTDQETTAVEKIVCYTYRSQEKGPGHTMGWGPHREAPGLVRRWGSKEKHRQELLFWFPQEGPVRQGKWR